MRKAAAFVALFLLLAGVSFRALAGEQPAAEWVPLFNGTNLNGWVAMNDGKFSVTNGVIHMEKSRGWLRTERPYTNFVFEAEWLALETNYNSGFFIRAGLDGQPFPTDVWQVNLKESAVGELLKGSKKVVPAVTPPMPVNQWVTFRVEVRGRQVALSVNGRRAWECNEFDAAHGYLGLQAEGKTFDFRNLRIRELGDIGEPKR